MALSKTQAVILEALAQSPLRRRFYWTGGTLLAEKYLQHRRSHDVDLFTSQPFRYQELSPLVQAIKKKAKLAKIEEKKIFDRWEFFFHNHGAVRCEFVHYDFKPLRPRRLWRGVLVDSLEDLAANKTMAAIERHEGKDVADIYFLMIKKNLNLQKLVRLAKQKFGLDVGPGVLLSQLVLNCRYLDVVRPMFWGSSKEQEELTKTIQRYFKNLSAHFIHGQLDR